MTRGLAWIFFLLVPLALEAQYSSHNGSPKYAPANGSKLLIMGQDLGAVGGLEDYSDGYVDHLGHHPAGVTTYTGFPGLTGLSDPANWGSGDVHARAYVEDASFDNTFIVIGLYLVDQLDYSIWQDSMVGISGSLKEKEGKLRLISDANRLVVQELNHAMMEGIAIWNISGSLLFRSPESKFENQIPSSLFAGNSMLVIQVRSGDRLIRTKIIPSILDIKAL